VTSNKHRQIETDVVVIGSGGAGGEAAIHARKGGARVLIVDRGTFGRSGGTITAGHTCTAAVGDDDSPELHFRDTVIGGYSMADQRLVEIYANEAPPTLYELDEWGRGQTFRKDENGEFNLVWPPGGHSRKRSVHYGFMTGPRIMWALRREIQRLDIPWMENILVTSILTHEGRVSGIAALDWKAGAFITVKAKAVVLAAGGYAMLWPFRYSTNTVETAGDVHGMAYEAGAEMVDMEFIQFVPTQADPRITHINPTLTNFPGWRPKLREHGKFTNSKGEDFLAAYDDVRAWNTTRDIRSYAIYNEVRQGRGTTHGGCYMDLTTVPPDVMKHEFTQFQGGKSVPRSYMVRCERVGFDISKEPMEVAPKAHFTGGGVRTDTRMMSTVQGLFAAGEIQGGVHGANRLGGNALTHVVALGRIAGQEAALYAGRSEGTAVSDKISFAEQSKIFGWINQDGKGESPIRLRIEMQEKMWDQVGIIRNEENLKSAISWFKEAKADKLPRLRLSAKPKTFNLEWATAVTLPRQLDTCLLVAQAALERRESRGNHHRDDCMAMDNDNWLKNIYLHKDSNGAMATHTEPVHVTTIDPREVIDERPHIND